MCTRTHKERLRARKSMYSDRDQDKSSQKRVKEREKTKIDRQIDRQRQRSIRTNHLVSFNNDFISITFRDNNQRNVTYHKHCSNKTPVETSVLVTNFHHKKQHKFACSLMTLFDQYTRQIVNLIHNERPRRVYAQTVQVRDSVTTLSSYLSSLSSLTDKSLFVGWLLNVPATC